MHSLYCPQLSYLSIDFAHIGPICNPKKNLQPKQEIEFCKKNYCCGIKMTCLITFGRKKLLYGRYQSIFDYI